MHAGIKTPDAALPMHPEYTPNRRKEFSPSHHRPLSPILFYPPTCAPPRPSWRSSRFPRCPRSAPREAFCWRPSALAGDEQIRARPSFVRRLLNPAWSCCGIEGRGRVIKKGRKREGGGEGEEEGCCLKWSRDRNAEGEGRRRLRRSVGGG